MNTKKQNIQLPLQTLSFVAAFTVWVLISSLASFITEDIHLSSLQLSLVTAIPVILGSILRIPIGFYTNRFGARYLFSFSFLFLIIPVLYLSFAHTLIDLLISGFLLGVAGATFSIGVTSIPKYYPKEKHGTVNGNIWHRKYRNRGDDIRSTCGCGCDWLGNDGSSLRHTLVGFCIA